MSINPNNTAVKRILADVRELNRHKTSRYNAVPLEDNIFEWHFTIRGPHGSDFEGGIYHGRILLPADYPFKPPNIIFTTKNGRFEVGTKICLSISAYHPEHWQPAWGVRTMLEAIISFLPTEGAGAIGALDWTPEERRRLAADSVHYTCPLCGAVNDLLSTAEDGIEDVLDAEIATQISQLHMFGLGPATTPTSSTTPSTTPTTISPHPDTGSDSIAAKPTSTSTATGIDIDTAVAVAVAAPSTPKREDKTKSISQSTDSSYCIDSHDVTDSDTPITTTDRKPSALESNHTLPPKPCCNQTPASIKAVRKRILGLRQHSHEHEHQHEHQHSNEEKENSHDADTRTESDSIVAEAVVANPPNTTSAAANRSRDLLDDLAFIILICLAIVIIFLSYRVFLRYFSSFADYLDYLQPPDL
eukprot:gene9364-19420_t